MKSKLEEEYQQRLVNIFDRKAVLFELLKHKGVYLGKIKMLTKLSQLKVTDINIILRANGSQVSGTKQAKIAELTKILGSDEIDTDDYELTTSEGNTEMQRQIDAMKALMESLTNAVQAIGMQQQAESNRRHESLTTATPPSVPRNETTPQPLTMQTNTNVKDVIGILPDFDPIKSLLPSEQFISKVEHLQRVYSWDDGTILFSAQHKLKGVAKDWLDAHSVFETWQEFLQALRMDFPSIVNTADVHREMMRRKRRQNETMTEYFYAMLAIGRRASIDEPSINTYIINGLNQNESTKALLAMNLRTCSELLLSIENMKSAQGSQQQFFSRNDGNVEHAQRQVNNGTYKGPKCYNCNQHGHIAAKCTAPQRKPRCSNCAKVGHDASSCKAKSFSVAHVGETNPSEYPPIMKNV